MKTVMKEIENYILSELNIDDLCSFYTTIYIDGIDNKDNRLMVGMQTFLDNGGWYTIKESIYDYGFVVYDGEELENWNETWDNHIDEFMYVLAVDYISTYLITESYLE